MTPAEGAGGPTAADSEAAGMGPDRADATAAGGPETSAAGRETKVAPQPEPEADPDAGPRSKVDAKPDAKPGPMADADPDAKPSTGPAAEAKSKAKPASKPVAAAKPGPESKPGPGSKPVPAPRPAREAEVETGPMAVWPPPPKAPPDGPAEAPPPETLPDAPPPETPAEAPVAAAPVAAPPDPQPAAETPAEPATELAPATPSPPRPAAFGDVGGGLGDEIAVPQSLGDLAFALRRLRTAIAGTSYPLVLPNAEQARRTSDAVVAQLDDYLLPRLARLDAPLLVVVGGSTGAGKSTLVNSLVRAPVSQAGVLRPTTRAPVLVCHPDDAPWFRQGRLLPGLTRTTRVSDDPHTLCLVAAPALTPGLALIDAPDIDSVVSTNRALAAQLLSAADLWLFVTSAARYADAVPWDLLLTAAYRGTVVALVLDRVPADAAAEVVPHLTELLGVHQFRGVPLFVLPETVKDGQGLLAEDMVAPIGQWLSGLAADAAARTAVVRQTVNGALAALEPIVDGLAEAAEDQAMATLALTDRAGVAYRAARQKVEHGLRDGALLRGEVLARWQEFVGTGELSRALEARIGRMRDRVVSAVSGRPAPGRELRTALESGLAALIRAAAAEGAEQTYAGWQAHPSGAALLRPDLTRPSAELPQRVEQLVRDWQHRVLGMVRAEAGDRRATARGAAYAVNATGLLVMVGVFASTAFIPTGLEVAVAGGTTVAAQKVLEAVFGDQAIRTLARKARDDLLSRVDAVLDAEAGRFLRMLPTLGLDLPPAQRLRETAEQVERARRKAALTADAGPVELALPVQRERPPEPPGAIEAATSEADRSEVDG
jgi:hypothetical protein